MYTDQKDEQIQHLEERYICVLQQSMLEHQTNMAALYELHNTLLENRKFQGRKQKMLNNFFEEAIELTQKNSELKSTDLDKLLIKLQIYQVINNTNENVKESTDEKNKHSSAA